MLARLSVLRRSLLDKELKNTLSTYLNSMIGFAKIASAWAFR